MDNISQRVRALRKKLSITQAECAKRMSFVRNYISLVENGYVPSHKFVQALELLEREPLPKGEGKPAATPPIIPLLSWAQAGTKEAWDHMYEREAFTDFNPRDSKAMAVQIRGDSMEPQFPQGTIAIVNPTRQPKSGDLVIAGLNDGTVLFKRLHVDGDRYTFISLNPIYPPLTLERAIVERVLPVGCTFQEQL